jgi:phosphoribosyl-ATP pyrophosphohydrolase/phosphoribosyl-AMP cyclohydrolase/histidinol dehydrogenase
MKSTTTFALRTADELTAHSHGTSLLDALDIARDIVRDVRTEGLQALRRYVTSLDGRAESDPLFLDRAETQRAWDGLTEDDRLRLDRIATRIRTFGEAQMRTLHEADVAVPGGRAGHTVAPVERAGCYAPGGLYPLPSTVLMTTLTARVAGVPEVWLATPAASPFMLAAAHVADVDGVLVAGGAQAIASLAYGVDPLKPCDVVVGPGNKYVTAAKHVVAGDVRIDMPAGPSELVIIADGSATPAIIAADLLAQAEHDHDALPILITTEERLVASVRAELERQLETLPTAPVARVALRNGGACLVGSLEEAIALSDTLAAEHVQVCTENAADVGRRLGHYGALFIGERSPEVLGDYGVGPNHVLPTARGARSVGGLSVFTFLRVRTWLACAGQPDRTLYDDVRWLARIEGLEGHARAVELRETKAVRSG